MKNITLKEDRYLIDIVNYFEESKFSTLEKLQNFPKYIPRQYITKFLVRNELFKKVLDVQGSIVECGVYIGGGLMTFAQLSSIYEPVNLQRKIIGFDTFTGFEEPSKKDASTVKKGDYLADSYEDIKKSIELYDNNRSIGHIEKVEVIKGDVSKTIPQYLRDNPHLVISLLYLDFDVYKPTKIALEKLCHCMPRGSIIAFDELNVKQWPGETLAVKEILGIDTLKIQRFPWESLISYAVLE